MEKQLSGNKYINNGFIAADSIDITYYTDPLCCWSWAFEPAWQKLLQELKGRITYRYVMGGLLPHWKHYHDALHAVTRPVQMGPVWMHAKQVTGMYLNDKLWVTDPPASSYPACIAVKCAALQSPQAEELLLYCLREAAMVKGLNIAKPEVIADIAKNAAAHHPDVFNAEEFYTAMAMDEGVDAFRRDMEEVKYKAVVRFPTLIARSKGYPAILIPGYRPYDLLADIIQNAFGKERS